MFDVVDEINRSAVLLAFVACAALGAGYFMAVVPKHSRDRAGPERTVSSV